MSQHLLVDDLPILVSKAPHGPRLVVTVNVIALEFLESGAAVDVSAGDRACLGVVMLSDGRNERGGAQNTLRIEQVLSLVGAPAVVVAAAHQMDGLPQILADVA